MLNYKLEETYLEDVYLHRPHLAKRTKYVYLLFILWFYVNVALTGIPVLRFKTVPEFSSGCYGLLTLMIMCGVSTSLLSQYQNIYSFIDKANEIIRKRSERPDLKLSYENMSKKNVKYVKLMRIVLLTNCLSPMLALLAYNLFLALTTGLKPEDYRLPFPIWLPFDWTVSLFPYSIAFAIDFLSCYFSGKVGVPVMCFIVESYLVLFEFNKDLKNEITTMNEDWKKNQNQNQVEIMQKMNDIIWFNARFNELIGDLTDIFEIFFFINLIWTLFGLLDSLLLLHFEMAKDDPQLSIVGVSFAAMTLSVGLGLVFTEIGEQLNSLSDEIYETICQLDWNTFPLRIQRMMPMVFITTQHPIALSAYGGVPYNRDTFKRVVNTAYSFFTIFRGFEG